MRLMNRTDNFADLVLYPRLTPPPERQRCAALTRGKRAVASQSQLFRPIVPGKKPWGRRTWPWLRRIPTKDERATGRDHARRSVVIPIGVIVAVAIICVVVAVLGSAQRADEVALATERQLFTRALHNHGERMLREVDAVANSEAAYRKIRAQLRYRMGPGLCRPAAAILFRSPFRLRGRSVRPLAVCHARQPPRRSELVQLGPRRPQSRARSVCAAAARTGGNALAGADAATAAPQNQRISRLQTFLGRPAILVAVAIASAEDLACKARRARRRS